MLVLLVMLIMLVMLMVQMMLVMRIMRIILIMLVMLVMLVMLIMLIIQKMGNDAAEQNISYRHRASRDVGVSGLCRLSLKCFEGAARRAHGSNTWILRNVIYLCY